MSHLASYVSTPHYKQWWDTSVKMFKYLVKSELAATRKSTNVLMLKCSILMLSLHILHMANACLQMRTASQTFYQNKGQIKKYI